MRRGLALGLLFVAAAAFGESEVFRNRMPRAFLQLGANYGYTNSTADNVAGATYAERFANPLVFEASLGTILVGPIYVGLRYETWNARRNFVVSGVTQIDTLRYQGGALDLGYLFGNPRVFWLAILSAEYPLVSRVDSSAGTFTPLTTPLTFCGRVRIGIRFLRFASLSLEGGYRRQKMGVFSSGGTPFLAGEELDLSGPFLGLGVLLHL